MDLFWVGLVSTLVWKTFLDCQTIHTSVIHLHYKVLWKRAGAFAEIPHIHTHQWAAGFEVSIPLPTQLMNYQNSLFHINVYSKYVTILFWMVVVGYREIILCITPEIIELLISQSIM